MMCCVAVLQTKGTRAAGTLAWRKCASRPGRCSGLACHAACCCHASTPGCHAWQMWLAQDRCRAAASPRSAMIPNAWHSCNRHAPSNRHAHLKEHWRLVHHDLRPRVLLVDAREEPPRLCIDFCSNLLKVIVLLALALRRRVRKDTELLLPRIQLLHGDHEWPLCHNVCAAGQKVLAHDTLEHRGLAGALHVQCGKSSARVPMRSCAGCTGCAACCSHMCIAWKVRVECSLCAEVWQGACTAHSMPAASAWPSPEGPTEHAAIHDIALGKYACFLAWLCPDARTCPPTTIILGS